MYEFKSDLTPELKENLRDKVSEILNDCYVKSANISVEMEDHLEKVSIELVYAPEKVTK